MAKGLENTGSTVLSLLCQHFVKFLIGEKFDCLLIHQSAFDLLILWRYFNLVFFTRESIRLLFRLLNKLLMYVIYIMLLYVTTFSVDLNLMQ